MYICTRIYICVIYVYWLCLCTYVCMYVYIYTYIVLHMGVQNDFDRGGAIKMGPTYFLFKKITTMVMCVRFITKIANIGQGETFFLELGPTFSNFQHHWGAQCPPPLFTPLVLQPLAAGRTTECQ